MRKDGRRVKHGDPMYTVVPHIMVDRCDSMNMIELFIPVEPMDKYIKEKRKEGIAISHLALVIAAYVRTIAEFPHVNRFVVNRRIYARKGLQVGMVVLKPGTSEQTMSKMYFDLEDDVLEVNRKLLQYVDENRKVENNNSTDKLIRTLLSIPGLCRVAVALLMWMDKHNIMPEAIIKASPFHASMTITNLASIRTNHIYHHIYNFGTTGQLISMGNLREIPKKTSNGIEFERCIPLGVVMDERIASGCYYAAAFKRMQSYLKDPTLMEGEPKVLIKEWENKKI